MNPFRVLRKIVVGLLAIVGAFVVVARRRRIVARQFGAETKASARQGCGADTGTGRADPRSQRRRPPALRRLQPRRHLARSRRRSRSGGRRQSRERPRRPCGQRPAQHGLRPGDPRRGEGVPRQGQVRRGVRGDLRRGGQRQYALLSRNRVRGNLVAAVRRCEPGRLLHGAALHGRHAEFGRRDRTDRSAEGI